jgi:hypothetical protein
MQLNPEGQARFREHLQNAVRKPCALCDSGNWTYDDTIFEMRQFAGGPLVANGAVKPFVTLTCQNCGNIVMLNAITTGIVRVEQTTPANTVSNAGELAASEETTA